MKIGLVGLTLVGLAGCAAHTTMRGSVVMKVSDTEAHVCMGKGEVREGEPIRVYRNVCKAPVPNRAWGLVFADSCRRERAGNGTVEKVLNEHYSVVRFAPGTTFEEGDTVEARGGK